VWVYRCRLCGREFTDVVELLVHVELEHASNTRVREIASGWKCMHAAGFRLSRMERFRDLREAGLAERVWRRE
jgi:hypothetical protein